MSVWSIVKEKEGKKRVALTVEATRASVEAMFPNDIAVEMQVPIGMVLEGNTFISETSIIVPLEKFANTTAFTGVVLALSNQAITYADLSPVLVNPIDANKFYPLLDTVVNFEGDIVDDLQQVVTAINAPRINLVVEMQADDKPNGREIYLVGDIVNGHLSVSGKFPDATNFKITAARNNRALDRLFAPAQAAFHMSFDTLDFLV